MEAPLLLESLVEDLLQRMGYDARVGVREAGTVLAVDLEVHNGAGALIGTGGEGIDALEDIIRRMFKRRSPDAPKPVVDVNGYRREHATAIREKAREIAERVKRYKETHVFPPMPARERRIVHMELAARGDVITESEGEGSARHVVVRPAP